MYPLRGVLTLTLLCRERLLFTSAHAHVNTRLPSTLAYLFSNILQGKLLRGHSTLFLKSLCAHTYTCGEATEYQTSLHVHVHSKLPLHVHTVVAIKNIST